MLFDSLKFFTLNLLGVVAEIFSCLKRYVCFWVLKSFPYYSWTLGLAKKPSQRKRTCLTFIFSLFFGSQGKIKFICIFLAIEERTSNLWMPKKFVLVCCYNELGSTNNWDYGWVKFQIYKLTFRKECKDYEKNEALSVKIKI